VAAGLLPINRPILGVTRIPAFNSTQLALEGNGFARNAFYPSTLAAPYRGSINFYGSWIGSDGSTGTTHTGWFRAVPKFAIYIAGYLTTPGNLLAVEVANADGSTAKVNVPPELAPAEGWWVREIALPQGKRPLKFRLVAVDGSTSAQGWFGFSDPFLIQSTDAMQIAKQSFMVVFVTAACIVLLFGPGLVLRERVPKMSIIWLPAPGIALLAMLGLLSWIGSGAVKPRYVSRVGLTALLLVIAYRIFRTPLSRITSGLERRVLAVVLLVICIAVAKSTYSLAPAGELYAGRISRTLEPSGRSDSRMPFHAVQLIGLSQPPNSDLAKMYYFPWDFSSRGIIASLAAAPIVLSSPVRVSRPMPDAPWQLFDPQGFSAFRIAMIVLAASALLAGYGVASYFLPHDWSYFASLVIATAPFIVHEVYFTWPKLLCALFVLWAAHLTLGSKYFAAGLLLGLGYLVHPSALVWLPALLGVAVIRKRTPRILLIVA
jgi:hypothetical protein